MARIASKHHELKEDKFVTNVFKAYDYVRANPNKILTYLVGIAIVVVIIIVFISMAKGAREKATAIFGDAYIYYQNNKVDKAIAEFQKLIGKYTSTNEHKLAYFYLGDLYLRANELDKAEEYFEKAASKIKSSDLKGAALYALAKIYKSEGNEEQYYAQLEKVVKKTSDYFHTPHLLLELGEHYQKLGDLERAKKFYKKIVDNYDWSGVFHQAKNKLNEIKEVE